MRQRPSKLALVAIALVSAGAGWVLRAARTSEVNGVAIPTQGSQADCEGELQQLRSSLDQALARAEMAEAELAEHQRASVNATVQRDEVARLTELELLGPSLSWDAAEENNQPDQVKALIDDLGHSCDGEVGLVELDCSEYPCITFQIPSSNSCRIPRGTLRGMKVVKTESGDEEVSFQVHATHENLRVVETRVDWRLSRIRHQLEDHDLQARVRSYQESIE